jgi:hypothetical protein
LVGLVAGDTLDGAADAVGGRQQILDHRRRRELDRVLALARRSTAQVLLVCERAQQLVLERRHLGFEARDGVAVVPLDRGVGDCSVLFILSRHAAPL